MKELFLPYDLCKSFDMLGFKDKVVAYYNYNKHDELIWAKSPRTTHMLTKSILWQQAIDFLRVKLNIHITIITRTDGDDVTYEFAALLPKCTIIQPCKDYAEGRLKILTSITTQLLMP